VVWMYILNLQDRVEKRRERILKALPTQQLEGKTILQITKDLGDEYSAGTIRQDLQIMVAGEEIQCDEARKPVTYWRGRQK